MTGKQNAVSIWDISGLLFAILIAGVIGYFIVNPTTVGTSTAPAVSFECDFNEDINYLVIKSGAGDTFGKNDLTGSLVIHVREGDQEINRFIWANRRGTGIADFPVSPGDSILIPSVSRGNIVYLEWISKSGGKIQRLYQVNIPDEGAVC
jgi:hypothetical protein